MTAPTSTGTTTVRPSRRRQIGYGLSAVVLFGVLPMIGVVLLLVDGGAMQSIIALVVVLLQVAVLASSVVNLRQRWVVGPEVVTLVRPPRTPRTWQRDGLRVEAEVTPRHYRGIRVGTSRVLCLEHADGTDRMDASLLGRAGLTAVIAAIRAVPGRRHGAGARSARRIDRRFEIDHDAIVRYRRWRAKWRAVGVVAGVVAFLAAGGVTSEGADWFVSAALATAFVIVSYLVSSVVLQVVRRPSGPVPTTVRVASDRVEIELPGGAGPDRHLLGEVGRIEVSEDLQGEGVLTLVGNDGSSATYSLTGRVDDEFRDDVAPDWDGLCDALHDVGDLTGIPVVDLQR